MINQPIEEKVKEWLSQGVAREWPEVVAFIENLLEQEKKRMIEEVEKMKTYTGGSSVNEKDRRVNKQEVLSIIKN